MQTSTNILSRLVSPWHSILGNLIDSRTIGGKIQSDSSLTIREGQKQRLTVKLRWNDIRITLRIDSLVNHNPAIQKLYPSLLWFRMLSKEREVNLCKLSSVVWSTIVVSCLFSFWILYRVQYLLCENPIGNTDGPLEFHQESPRPTLLRPAQPFLAMQAVLNYFFSL